MLLSSGNHDFGDDPVGLRPCIGQLGSPRCAEETLQRGQQACPNRRIVLRHDGEATVVTTQLLEQGHHVIEAFDVGDHSAERGDQFLPLRRHLDREHRAHLGVAQEQMRVEVQRDIVAGGRDLPPAGL